MIPSRSQEIILRFNLDGLLCNLYGVTHTVRIVWVNLRIVQVAHIVGSHRKLHIVYSCTKWLDPNDLVQVTQMVVLCFTFHLVQRRS